tara:strand:+ start:1235 stop:1882 length:648 start_codon:yes stop_codon:yes gene_type:complete
MYKKKSIFVTFEGIEGSGKSFQCQKLYKNLRKNKIPVILTREPGGTDSAEKIRQVILDDYFIHASKEKFDKYTDTLLYLAARNEHVKNKIKPSIIKKKTVICDRFIDSTIAYQVYGKKVDKTLIDFIHKKILLGIKPDLTFILKVNLSKALNRIKKRKTNNRYDKFSRNFYKRVQDSFLKIARTNKKRYIVVDNSNDSKDTENIIYSKFLERFEK